MMQVVDFTGLMYVCQNVASSLLASSSCIKSVKNENQDLTICNLLQVVETTCIKPVDEKFWQLTCIKLVDNFQQTCYHQAEPKKGILITS